MVFIKHQQKISRHQQGLSIVELLVALGLGMLITTAVMQVFMSSQQTERLEQGLSQVQDTGRFALDMMASDLRRSGHMGCMTPQYKNEGSTDQDNWITILANDTGLDESAFSRQAVSGFERNASGTLVPTPPSAIESYFDEDSILSADARNNSDILTVYFGISSPGLELVNPTSKGTPTTSITITNNKTCIRQNDLIMLSSCSQTHIARVTNQANPDCTSNTPAVLEFDASANSGPIAEDYDTESSVLNMTRVTYYVADTGRIDTENNPVFALYRRTNNSNAEELVEGVEYLQVEYGELITTGATSGNTRFVPADQVTDMSNVYSVRLGILVRSMNNSLDEEDTKAYDLPGASIGGPASATASKHAGGNFMRRAFVTTVKLRQRT